MSKDNEYARLPKTMEDIYGPPIPTQELEELMAKVDKALEEIVKEEEKEMSKFDAKKYVENFDLSPYREMVESGTYQDWQAAASDFSEWKSFQASQHFGISDEILIADMRHELREAFLEKVAEQEETDE